MNKFSPSIQIWPRTYEPKMPYTLRCTGCDGFQRIAVQTRRVHPFQEVCSSPAAPAGCSSTVLARYLPQHGDGFGSPPRSPVWMHRPQSTSAVSPRQRLRTAAQTRGEVRSPSAVLRSAAPPLGMAAQPQAGVFGRWRSPPRAAAIGSSAPVRPALDCVEPRSAWRHAELAPEPRDYGSGWRNLDECPQARSSGGGRAQPHSTA